MNYQHVDGSSPRQPSSESSAPSEAYPPPSAASPNRLRYEAYAAPQSMSSLKNLTSQCPDEASLCSPGNVARDLPREGNMTVPLAKPESTITPGDLTLAAAERWLESGQTSQVAKDSKTVELDDLASRVDLIALDPPFIADHANNRPEPDFEESWNSMQNSNLRGWCEASTDTIVEVLQTLQLYMRITAIDQPPFEGEVKVLVHAVPARKVRGAPTARRK
ncbi:hypothetical protein EDC04DRAFT_1868187 [Pisolithus marmoratus]|nr:hypothetical protein EDC04DRAFT_1868187 [Pisolithus marmoratus]